MMPLFAVLKVRKATSRGLRLWIPLFLVWLLLLPLVLLLSPLFFMACSLGRLNPFRALSVAWQVLGALSGTHIELASSGTSIGIRIV